MSGFGGGRGGGYDSGYDRDGGRGRRGGFNGGRRGGRGGRRGGAGDHAGGGAPSGVTEALGETPKHDICKFYATSGQCRNGDRCTYSHCIAAVITKHAHTTGIRSIACLQVGEAPHVLTGSLDGTIQAWNLLETTSPAFTIMAKGPVQAVEVSGNNIMWADDEPVEGDPIDLAVSVVNLFMEAAPALSLKASEFTPFTHPMQVVDFKIVVADGGTFVITGGGEGSVRLWRFNADTASFVLEGTMDGHSRGVTSVVMHNSNLWTGSIDRTIRVWNVVTRTCLGVLSSRGGGPGHTDVVTCLEVLPAVPSAAGPGESYIVSGGSTGELRVWSGNGDLLHFVNHGTLITAMKVLNLDATAPPVLVIAFQTGQVNIRSIPGFDFLVNLDAGLHRGSCIRSVCNVGHRHFATAGETGFLTVWKIGEGL